MGGIAELRFSCWHLSKSQGIVSGKVIGVNAGFLWSEGREVVTHHMSVRMKDIARDLGVSVVTISEVLRNHPDIGDETRERVLTRVSVGRNHPEGRIDPLGISRLGTSLERGFSKPCKY